jgi:hypothetical protein
MGFPVRYARRLGTAVIVGCCALVAGPAQAGEPHVPAEGHWVRYAPAWDVQGVTQGERTLELIYYAGCGGEARNLHAVVRETPTDVIVTFSGEVFEVPPSGMVMSCPPPRKIVLDVPLRLKLTGRLIRGRSALSLSNGPRLEEVGSPVPVPSLVGFSPRDAEHALALGQLRGTVHEVPRRSGLPRVVGQGRLAGSEVDPGSAVILYVGRG